MTATCVGWASCLREIKVIIDLLTDPDMAMLIDKSTIGGISAILSPLGYANNNQMGKLYDTSMPDNTILYVDANSVYRGAMSQYLPTSNFKWVEVSRTEDWAELIRKQGTNRIRDIP